MSRRNSACHAGSGGRLEVETTDGRMRRWRPGDMFMADDSKGKGHRTRVVEGRAKLVFLRLGDEFDPMEWTRRGV